MLSLQSDPRQYNLNLQQLQQPQPQHVARVPYNVGTDHHREESSLALASSSNITQETPQGLNFNISSNLSTLELLYFKFLALLGVLILTLML